MRYASIVSRTGLLAALTVATFVACKKEKEQNGPSIVVPNEPDVIAGDQTLPPGTYSLRFKVIFQKGSGKDDADLKDFSFSVNDGVSPRPIISNRPISGQTFTFDTTFSVNGVNGQILTYTFTVRDKNDKTASRSFRITFQDTSSQPTRYIDILLNGQYTNQTDTAGTHLRYQVGSGTLTLQNRTQANANPSEILFVYYYSSQSGRHSIISPAILRDPIYNGFPVKWDNPSTQTTNFRSVDTTRVRFDGISYQGIIDAYNNGTDVNNEFSGNGNQRAECTARRLIAFRQGNIYGLVRVESVTSNPAGAVLSVKVARP